VLEMLGHIIRLKIDLNVVLTIIVIQQIAQQVELLVVH
jgi:hypothetical protein